MAFLRNLIGGLAASWQACLATFVAGALLAGIAVWRVESWREGAHQNQQAQQTVRLVVHQGQINSNLATIYVPKLIAIQANTGRINQEIPEHVTPQIDHDFPVPLGFVRMWNDASHGPIPGPAAGSAANPSGVPLSDVAHAHADDIGTLDTCRVALNEWWDW